MISNAAFVQLMQQINLPSAAAEYDRFALYCTQLQEWNQRMNLTAITDDEGVAEKHFADSLLPLTMVQLPIGASLVDVGSGAGFPGLPMALARPDLRVTFLDSLQKRLTFLAQLTQMLGVPAAMLHARAEDAGQDKAYREQFDVATARAVANLNALAEYCLPLVKVGGLFLALKGAAGEEELAAAQGAITKLGGRVEAIHRYALPSGDARVLIVIRKEHPTPPQYRRPHEKETPHLKAPTGGFSFCKNVSRETFLQSTHTWYGEKAAALLRGGIKSGTLFGGSFCKGQLLCGGQFVVACRRRKPFAKA